MAKRKLKAQNIYNVSNFTDKNNPLPIYYLYGPDAYAKNAVAKLLEEKLSPLIASEFDKEIVNCNKSTTVEQIVTLASSFPFGGGKKLIIIKNFNQIKVKKTFIDYVKSPSEFTVLIIIDNSETLYETELLKELVRMNYIFNASGLKGSDWNSWIVSRARELKIKISGANAQILLEVVGEDKSLLLRQLEKFADYLGEGGEVDKNLITELASKTKGYVMFDLNDAIKDGNKEEALKIGLSLLRGGMKIGEIINSLTSVLYLSAVSLELKRTVNNKNKEAGILHQHPFYYEKARDARFFRTNGKEKLERVFKALLNADLAVKTSALEDKTVFSTLISEIFQK